MSRLTALAMVLALSLAAKAEDTIVKPIVQATTLTLQVFGAPGWNVGDTADYNIDMGFIKGKMHSFVREETERGYWMNQDMDMGPFGKQKVEILLDKGTFQILEMRVNGQRQDPPKQNFEVVETREEKVTVPAGIFETMYIKVKDKSDGKITQAWINPEVIPMNGMAKTIAPGQFGDVKVDLTSYHRKEFSARNPVGEKATYNLDNSSARTTSMIKKGTFTGLVTAYLPDNADGPAYSTKLTYDMTIAWVGRKTGTKEMATPADYFQPEFMERLRREREIVLPQFTITHQGYADARNPGKIYRNCDKILIHNIDTSTTQLGVFGFISEAMAYTAASVGATAAEVEDLKIAAHINEGTPVLGAVKIDISGRARGFNFKAGFDLKE